MPAQGVISTVLEEKDLTTIIEEDLTAVLGAISAIQEEEEDLTSILEVVSMTVRGAISTTQEEEDLTTAPVKTLTVQVANLTAVLWVHLADLISLKASEAEVMGLLLEAMVNKEEGTHRQKVEDLLSLAKMKLQVNKAQISAIDSQLKQRILGEVRRPSKARAGYRDLVLL
jgi:hypothetical protein